MKPLQINLTRRSFVKAMGAMVVAINVPVQMEGVTALAATAPGPNPFGPLNPDGTQIGSWLAVGKDGLVTIFTGKVELGTGTLTATRQVVAEELDVAFSSTKIVQAVTGQTVDQGTTAGSQTMRTQWASGLRISAASARQALLAMAATKLGVTADKLTVSNGVVSVVGDSSKTVSYADLVAGSPITGTVNQKVKTKDASSYKVIGQSLPREDIPAKITAQFTYVQDVKVAGMLHGRVVRPTRPSPLSAANTAKATIIKGTLANATLGSVDESSVKHLPGSVKVVTKNNFVGVVAQREEQAIAAAQALHVTWNDPASLPDQAALYDTIKKARVDTTRVLSNQGDVEGAFGSAAKQVQAVYQHPYQAHGSIGPSCAVANVHDGIAEVWSGTQSVYALRQTLATALSIDPSNIRINYVEGSGCYGINGADDVSLAAALMSQLAGKPVRVQYMRADEISWENFGTPMVMSLKGGLDASGHIVSWDYENWGANRGGRPAPPGNIPTGVLAGFPETRPPASPPPSPPLGDDGSNALTWYSLPVQRTRSYGVNQPWLFTGPLRSPARLQNTFAQESFMDELAAAAGMDPVAFRLMHVGDDNRLADVINRAANSAGWQARPSPAPGQTGTVRTGRGLAATRYEGNSSWVAVAMTVSVDTSSGVVTPTQVVAAQDCGTVINPDGCKAQIEGCIVQGLSRTLMEEIKFDKSGVLSVDWMSYPIITFNQLPDDIKIELVNRPGFPALGVGEAVISAVAGAMGNAIFDATGKRLRTLPFTPDRVKAGLTA
jgi:CO/xanthine dehydrogenase Mo-binding subunit